MTEQQPFITAVLPIRNEERYVAATIESLLGQEYPRDRFEIIVADGMSDDRTGDIVNTYVRTHPQVQTFPNRRRLSSAGRNIGFRAGRRDLFVVIDGHSYVPDDQLFRNMVRAFVFSDAQCLGRAQPLDPPGLTPFQHSVALARGARIGHGAGSLIYSMVRGYVSPVSNGAMYRREVFSRIGYVDEGLDACEDMDFNYRVELAGMKSFMDPSLTVFYYPRETIGRLFKQMGRYGLGRMQFMRRHPEVNSLSSFVPFFFVLFVFSFPLQLIFRVSRLLVLGAAGVYGTLIGVTSLRIAVRHGVGHLVRVPAILATIHAGLGWGVLAGLVNRFILLDRHDLELQGDAGRQVR